MEPKKSFANIVLAVGLTVLLAGCAFPTDFFFEPPQILTNAPTSTPAVQQQTQRLTDTPSPSPTTAVPCAYAWANKLLPDETAQLQQAVKDAGLNGVTSSASAYGENCLDVVQNKVLSFSIMQTDFYFNVPVQSVDDKFSAGAAAEELLKVTALFPPGKVPGSNPGYVSITYQDAAKTVRLWFRQEMGSRALEAGLKGAALFDALSQAQ